jgi:FMN-dependent NADH-azoreductase
MFSIDPTLLENTMNILQINGSARLNGSNSTRVADAITARLKARHPEATVELRDLARDPHPVLDEAALSALFTPAEQRTPEQSARVALDDALIAQLQRADVIVLGVPMYNFSVSVQIKSWIDAVARAGQTFRYTANGPEGLVTGKKVYVGLARGGIYRDTERDSQVPYLKGVLGLMGMTDVEFIYAEGVNMGQDRANAAFDEVAAQIDEVVA